MGGDLKQTTQVSAPAPRTVINVGLYCPAWEASQPLSRRSHPGVDTIIQVYVTVSLYRSVVCYQNAIDYKVSKLQGSVSQTMVRGPPVVLETCPCGP